MLRANFDYTKPWRAQASRMVEQVCIVVRPIFLLTLPHLLYANKAET
jgi:hypothetical protein